MKQDVKVGDSILHYLATAKEPECIVVSITENYVTLQNDDSSQSWCFEKLIGGWVLIKSMLLLELDNSKAMMI